LFQLVNRPLGQANAPCKLGLAPTENCTYKPDLGREDLSLEPDGCSRTG
jgi:hypothetical protein